MKKHHKFLIVFYICAAVLIAVMGYLALLEEDILSYCTGICERNGANLTGITKTGCWCGTSPGVNVFYSLVPFQKEG
jgi:hypothetical protein